MPKTKTRGVPGIGLVEFPDDMTDEEIDRASLVHQRRQAAGSPGQVGSPGQRQATTLEKLLASGPDLEAFTPEEQVDLFEEHSPGLMGLAGLFLPHGAQLVGPFARSATRAAGKFLRPIIRQMPREKGIERLAQAKLGVPGASAERIITQGPQRSAAFEKAMAQTPSAVSPRGIATAINDAIAEESKMASPNKAALRILGDFKNKFGQGRIARYQDLIKETQRLRETAQGFIESKVPGGRQVGRILYNLRQRTLEEMDKVSDAARQANALTRRQESAQDIINALRKPKSGMAVRQLLEDQPYLIKSFNLDTSEKLNAFFTDADRIEKLTSAGKLRAIPEFLSKHPWLALAAAGGGYLFGSRHYQGGGGGF